MYRVELGSLSDRPTDLLVILLYSKWIVINVGVRGSLAKQYVQEIEVSPGRLHNMENKPIEVVGAVFRGEAQGTPAVLAFRRRLDKSAGGKWEFPGGKVEGRETQNSALVREIREELGINANVGELVVRASTEVGDRTIDLACYWATTVELPTTSSDHDAIQWVTVTNLRKMDWAEPDLPAVEAIETILTAEASVINR